MAKRCLQAELLAQPWRPHGDVGMEQPWTRHQQGLGAHRCSANNSNVTNLAWVSKALLPWHQSLLLRLLGLGSSAPLRAAVGLKCCRLPPHCPWDSESAGCLPNLPTGHNKSSLCPFPLFGAGCPQQSLLLPAGGCPAPGKPGELRSLLCPVQIKAT